ncbi:ketopantoate reductase family protein [Ferirhizobium litorale]|uniref:2-dehydropantoate 2-reductase n=1 Tax=Ferirhizobium litorale TaxID=2927786 RepID=A0AAE3QHZ2_9HYPH|nr:2-dehydropantoate 2-reductase [Fererhizobium litorale]MDI7924218.1 2-dehydropantoate 2-reductase [Fererhizobium litorale]
MRIAMMGSGGIGGYLGLRLAKSGADVSFIARGAHLQAMRDNGLRLESPLGNVDLPRVTATDDPAEIGKVDIVVVAVKLYDCEAAGSSLAPLVGTNTRVVTLLNGIDSADILAGFVPRAQIVCGTTYVSSYVEAPGLIKQAGAMTEVTLGGRSDPVIEAFQDTCGKAEGIDLLLVDDVDQQVWSKFVLLSAFSGATSLMRSSIGPILADVESRQFIDQLRDEGMAIAAAAGHPMADDFAQQATSLWQRIPGETKSSMANDLARRKRIEVAWLSGRMHSLGREFGVPTPAHTAVYRALHLHAKGTA